MDFYDDRMTLKTGEFDFCNFYGSDYYLNIYFIDILQLIIKELMTVYYLSVFFEGNHYLVFN